MIILEQRKQIVSKYSQYITHLFPETDRYNIIVFGSFLTNNYHLMSDIDIGVFSYDESLQNRIRHYTLLYFEEQKIPCDVVLMDLDLNRPVNLSILLYHSESLTEYCPDELIEYAGKMTKIWSKHPMRRLAQSAMEEVYG